MKVHVYQDEILHGNHFKIIYRGQTNKFHEPDGFGISFKHGDVYIGSFRRGYHHGYGILKCHRGYKKGKNKWSFLFVKRGIYVGRFKFNRLIDGKYLIMDGPRIHIGYKKNGKAVGTESFVSSGSVTTIQYDSCRHFGKLYLQDQYSLDIAYLHKSQFQGLYYGMYQSPKFHVISHFSKNDQSGPVLFLRYTENQIIYKLLVEFRKSLCEKVYYIQDDNNLLWNPLYYMEQNMIEIPYDYRCPIQHEIMIQPHRTQFNTVYELKNLLKWISMKPIPRDPLTNQCFELMEFDDHIELRDQIFDFIWTSVFSHQIIGTLSE